MSKYQRYIELLRRKYTELPESKRMYGKHMAAVIQDGKITSIGINNSDRIILGGKLVPSVHAEIEAIRPLLDPGQVRDIHRYKPNCQLDRRTKIRRHTRVQFKEQYYFSKPRLEKEDYSSRKVQRDRRKTRAPSI